MEVELVAWVNLSAGSFSGVSSHLLSGLNPRALRIRVRLDSRGDARQRACATAEASLPSAGNARLSAKPWLRSLSCTAPQAQSAACGWPVTDRNQLRKEKLRPVWEAKEVWPASDAGRQEGHLEDSAVMQVEDGDEDAPNRDALLLTIFYMTTLDLTPYPCNCGKHEPVHVMPSFSHELQESCPYEGKGFEVGSLSICCSIRAEKAFEALQSRGETQAAQRMCKPMSCEEASMFARELLAIAERLTTEYLSTRTTAPDKRIAVDEGSGLTFYPLVEDLYLVYVVNPIVDVAGWYELTAKLHFAVRACRVG